MSFSPGQRYYSLTEPELGIGLVESLDGRQVVISFPAREITRRYSIEDPPLVRARLTIGQQARSQKGTSFCIQEVIVDGELLRYHGEGYELSEAELDSQIDVMTPENRLSSGQIDDFRLFDLRSDAHAIRHRILSSPVRGFLGGRIRLFDHQLSIARDVCNRHQVRILLADEVGLGKTIEALLILHQMLLTERIENALILVPPSLVHQWLAEAYLRFNLILRVMGKDTHGGGTIDVESEDLPEQLLDAQLFICPFGIDVGESFTDNQWDIVIVDEAHHLQPDSAEFSLVETLAHQTQHIMLLSATPDRHGQEAHFRRLSLLDPARFHDIDAYFQESKNYRDLASIAESLSQDVSIENQDRLLLQERLKDTDLDDALASRKGRQLLLKQLLDLHGIGRIMFRNVRARIPGFPKRVPHPVEINGGNVDLLRQEFLSDIGRDPDFQIGSVKEDPRTKWLEQLLNEHANEKFLVLCANRHKVEAFAEALSTGNRKIARFHEDMGVIERDRQASWFLDSAGPQIVISSAIGAEGRNFQVAKRVVLLDLPLNADRLEQSIGRIDRIGQGAEAHIYVAAVANTPQARLRRWFDEALKVFSRPWHGSPAIEREFGNTLIHSLLESNDEEFGSLIARARDRNTELVAELEGGRDRLLELTSFEYDSAEQLQTLIAKAESSAELEDFMIDSFERGGLDVETIGPRSYAVRAGIDYHRPFPGFIGEEMGVTFDRDTALTHPDRTLLTWDHPMVRDNIDSLLAHEIGNASVAKISGDKPELLLEALYVAESTVARHLRADRFMPPTPIRVVTNIVGEEVQLDILDIRGQLQPIDPTILESPQVGTALPKLIERSREIATERAPKISATARETMYQELEPVVARLTELAKVNPSIRDEEIHAARKELANLDEGLQSVRIRLDGLRLLLVSNG